MLLCRVFGCSPTGRRTGGNSDRSVNKTVSEKMRPVLASFLLFLNSCCPCLFLERPSINVQVLDSQSKEPVSNSLITYEPLPVNDEFKTSSALLTPIEVYSAPRGRTQISGHRNLSLCLFMESYKLRLIHYRLSASAAGYETTTVERRFSRNGPYINANFDYKNEVIEIRRR